MITNVNFTQVSTIISGVLKQIIADHSAYPLVIEQANRAVVDQGTQVKPYLKVDIKGVGADQADLNARPIVKQFAQLWLTVVCKTGAGEVDSRALLDFVMPYFDLKSLGPLQFQAVAVGAGREVNGLWKLPVIVNFFYHRLT